MDKKRKIYKNKSVVPVNLMNAVTQKNIKDKGSNLMLPNTENVIDAKNFVDDNEK